MKVTTWKTVEVECECEVEMDDMLNEFSQRVEESSSEYWRRMLPAMDRMTRIIERISDETIAGVKSDHRVIIKTRLIEQAARW